MEIVNLVMGVLKRTYGLYVLIAVILIGIFLITVDCQSLKEKKLKKDAKRARAIGLVYLIGGPILYFALKLI